jgi:hypothetical protein
MTRRPITFICAYYDNAAMLREQLRIWRSFPPEVKAAFHAIVTDDVSPTPAKPHVEPTGIASIQLYRTLEKRPWNWLFGRNLGAEKSHTRWIVLTDIDHVLPVETVEYLQTADLDDACVYRFTRVDAPDLQPKLKDGKAHPHPNTWCLTIKLFDRIGGYDERFSGHYGSDGEFRDRVHAHAKAVVMLPQVHIRYPREVIADASTTAFPRKSVADGEAVARIRAERAQIPNWRPLRVTFPYVHELTLEATDRRGWRRW